MTANKLKLKPDKTEMLLVNDIAAQGLRSQAVLEGLHPPKEKVCCLGVLLNCGLQFKVKVSLSAM